MSAGFLLFFVRGFTKKSHENNQPFPVQIRGLRASGIACCLRNKLYNGAQACTMVTFVTCSFSTSARCVRYSKGLRWQAWCVQLHAPKRKQTSFYDRKIPEHISPSFYFFFLVYVFGETAKQIDPAAAIRTVYKNYTEQSAQVHALGEILTSFQTAHMLKSATSEARKRYPVLPAVMPLIRKHEKEKKSYEKCFE